MKSSFNSAAFYVIANVVVSAIGFLRNILFMRTLEPGDLGQVAMLQTIVVVVGFIQLGLINGGYRLYVGADSSSGAQINNIVMTNIASIGMLLLPAVSFWYFIGGIHIPNIATQTLLFACVIGLATMGATWVNNTLIASARLGTSSAVNLCASAASLFVALAPGSEKLLLALIALLLQPICVLIMTLVIHAPSRPRIAVDATLTRKIIKIGFAPYCAAIVALTNFQIERWFIVVKLGSDAMGMYYLTVVYSTIFTLVPISLLNLFYPKTVSAFDRRDKAHFDSLIRKHLLVICSYIGLTVVLTFALLSWVLDNYLKTYAGQQSLVYLALPGLIAYALFDNLALILQSAKKMLNIFLFALIALALNIVALAWASASDALTLDLAATFKSLSFIVAAIVIAADLYIRRRRLLAWH